MLQFYCSVVAVLMVLVVVLSRTYQSNLQKIATFNTVEDFWR